MNKFIAINFIQCEEHYVQRFEELFLSRAHAIDKLPGFIDMEVLRPSQSRDEYLIVSRWKSEDDFNTWTRSPEFLEGHKRGFEDLAKARQRGEKPPMTSTFKTYHVMAE